MIERRRNVLLQLLEPAARSQFQSRFSEVFLDKGQTLHEPGEAVSFVIFPETAVLAIGAETTAGDSVNVSLVGNEGVFGALEACGSRVSFSCVSIQVPGYAMRIPAAAYRELYDFSNALRTGVHKQVEIALVEARQYVACNALHTVENRLARTLLDIADRLGEPRLPLTQAALSQLLGVQRSTVAVSLGHLQRQGWLRSGRGMIEVVSPAGLEQAVCACRETVTYARTEIQSSEPEACEAS